MPATYRLQRSARPSVEPPALDVHQRRVLAHERGPLLVLAGPGTGKTTTLVEAVVDRVERRGVDPGRLLVLTFSRKAAADLRDRITARIRRTISAPMSSTFHSFCLALVRSHQPADLYPAPVRLLSSAEQDVRLHDLLAHSAEVGTVAWPEVLRRALPTRGFAREVHALIGRATELGLAPAELVRIGLQAERPDWTAVARFMEEYLTVLDFEGALDYTELIHRAVLLSEAEPVRSELRARFDAVFVDEYQDTDPAQVRLLQAIAGDGRDLVAVGDPDQSIYAFRGAQVRGILEFPTDFPTANGSPAPVVALETTRRFGAELLAASRRVAAGIGVSGAIDAQTFRRFRSPRPASGAAAGSVETMLFTSTGAEAEHVADLLRRAHLVDGVAWSEMAVLVRSGRQSIPSLRRALVAAGVPVEVAGDELPLHAEPAVRPLLTALRAALDPAALSVEGANELVLSPLGNVDAAGLRALGRLLRDRAAGGSPAVPASAELVRDALLTPELLGGVPGRASTRVRALGSLIGAVHAELGDGGPAEQALWSLWQGTDWPRRLAAAVDTGGSLARTANRDLDAVCALFDLAARAEERQVHTSVSAFLAELQAEQIPADTRAERAVRGDAVRLLTAHRSKGLEWRLVVVSGVQDGSWPDVRRRGNLLQPDRLSGEGLTEPPGLTAMVAEERRLFYVAVTRARERLVVTAVEAPEADGPQPSRLFDGLPAPTRLAGRPDRPLSLTGLVGALRRVASDRGASPELRRAAAARLAGLARERLGGRALAPAADPARWWGLRERSDAAAPIRPRYEPIELSGSALGGLLECPRRWFLGREAHGESPRSSSMGFGSVLHVLADQLARQPTGQGESDREALIGLLDSVWDQLHFDGAWIASRERGAAVDAIHRLVGWAGARPDRRLIGSELSFEVITPLTDDDPVESADEQVRLKGRVDRLEQDSRGDLHVVDFKTGKRRATGSELADNPQLGLYQLAVDHGAFADVTDPVAHSGGAELVQLRVGEGALPKVQEQSPQTPDESGRRPVQRQLAQAVDTLRAERFDALAGQHCRFCDFEAGCPARTRAPTVLS